MSEIVEPRRVADHDTEQAIAELQRSLYGLQEQRAAAQRVRDRDAAAREVVERLDGEIAVQLARLRELRPPTAGEQLAALEIEISAAEIELRQFSACRSATVEAKLKREPEGQERLQAIDEQIGTAEGRLSALRQRHAQLIEHIAAERAEDYRRAAGAKPGRLAELHRERVALAQTATSAAHALVTALRGIDENGASLAALLDDQGPRNFLSASAFRRRASNALARAFAIKPNEPLTAANSLLGLASDAVGAQVHWSLTEWEQQGLDDLVPFYLSEAEAEEARHRLEQRRCRTIVAPVHGAFALVPFEHVFGDESSARRAAIRSTTPMAAIAHGGGFVLLPARFFAEAA